MAGVLKVAKAEKILSLFPEMLGTALSEFSCKLQKTSIKYADTFLLRLKTDGMQRVITFV